MYNIKYFTLLSFCFTHLCSLSFSQTNTAESYIETAEKKVKNKDYRDAIIDYTIALEIEEKIEAYLGRAKARIQTKDLEGALSDYDSAILLNSKEAVLFNNRGNLKDQLFRSFEAIEDYNRAIQLDQNYINAYYNRAIAHYNTQKYEAAQDDFKVVLRDNKKDAEAYFGLGLTLQKLDNLEEACAYFEEAERLGMSQAKTYREKFCK